MVSKPHVYKEISAEVFEQDASSNIEDIFRIQEFIKRYKKEVDKLEANDDNLEKYENYITKLKSVIDGIIALGLGEDESKPNYEFIDDSRIRLEEDILVLPDDSSDILNQDGDTEFIYTRFDEQNVCEISEKIYLPCTIFERLYIHQKRGLKWLAGLHHKKCGGIVADEMGLGKTVTVLAFFRSLIYSMDLGSLDAEDGLDVLIVCPATVIPQWKDEVGKWIPSVTPIVFHGSLGSHSKAESLPRNNAGKHRMVVTSYDMLRTHIKSFRLKPSSYVVLDEGQKIRNPDAAITLAVKTLRTPHRLILSGSPIQNNLIEFWSLMDFVAPGQLGTLPLFIEQIVDPISKSINTCNTSIAYNFALRLRDVISPFICRNLKSDCVGFLKLPEKTENIIMCGLTHAQYHVYIALLKRMGAIVSDNGLSYNESCNSIHLLLGRNPRRVFVLITLLRKVCNHPDLVLEEKPKDYGLANRSSKLLIALDILANWEKSGHKVLLFTQTVQMLNIIHSNLLKVYNDDRISRIDGEVPIKRRSAILDSFERDKNIFLLLLTTRVGGVGLNLTCADRILIFDPDWNPMTDMQARERSYRIGQIRDVVIYRLVTSKTVEEIIYRRQLYKYYLSEKILKDPGVSNYNFLKTSAWNHIPPSPSGPNDTNGYCNQVEKKISSIDFEMELKKLKRKRNLYLRSEDVATSSSKDNPILSTIFANHDVDGIIMHDYMEQPLSADVGNNVCVTVDNSFALLKRSQDERGAYDISVPTWTGENGIAAAPARHKRRDGYVPSRFPGKVNGKHSRIKLVHHETTNSTAMNNRHIAKTILDYFIGMPNFKAPTGQVIQHFGPLVPEYYANNFKAMLKKMCTLKRHQEGPNYWELKEGYRSHSLH